ncbi:MAG: hypothetical protein L0Y72_32395 [Gemmataceae bacterium]|nr:hypothetical protein [Gemmataceae bacterium]MCI0743756.1 hypothetical protein [Gemmataceae bacterium]
MPIRISCSCGKKVVARDETAGKVVLCGSCGRKLAVPPMGKAVSPQAAPVAAPAGMANSGAPIPRQIGIIPHVQQPAGNWLPRAVVALAAFLVVAGLVIVVIQLYNSGSETDKDKEVQVALNQPPIPDTKDAEVSQGGQPKEPKVEQRPDPPQRQDEPRADPVQKKDERVEDKKEESPRRKFVEDKRFKIPVETATDRVAGIEYKVRRLRVPENAPARKLKLAVSPSGSDNIAQVLTDLAIPYDNIFLDGPAGFGGFGNAGFPNKKGIGKLAGDWSAERLQAYDVVFLNCGGGGSSINAQQSIRGYIEKGGTLYASDLQYTNVLAIFPEMRAEVVPFGGIPQTLKAKVIEDGLREFLGVKEIELHFNAGGWMPAVFKRDSATTYLEGSPDNPLAGLINKLGGGVPGLPDPKNPKNKGKPAPNPFGKLPANMQMPKSGEALPLLVKFRHGEGTVIFTSFHNSAQVSDLEKKLLNYLVFSAVTAKAESNVTKIMLDAGFDPQNLKTIQIAPGKSTPLQTHNHPGGGLQVAVGFENLGAKLKLTLTGPNGQKIEEEQVGTFLLEIANAPAGNWQYSVTAVEAPFQNFPIVLAVGKAK